MDRTSFYNIVNINGLDEFDYLDNALSKFQMNYSTVPYTVTDTDLLRPDLISYSVYGTVDYWWIICYVNQIQNPFTDLVPGTVLTIPSLLDVFEFLKKYHRSS
jgi:hypothetical protein